MDALDLARLSACSRVRLHGSAICKWFDIPETPLGTKLTDPIHLLESERFGYEIVPFVKRSQKIVKQTVSMADSVTRN